MTAARFALAFVLAATALLKLSDAGAQGALLPRSAYLVVAAVEVAVAVLLVTRKTWRWGAWSGLVLGWAFLMAIVYGKMAGWDLADCGCFGRLELTRWQHAAVASGIALCSAGLVAGADLTGRTDGT